MPLAQILRRRSKTTSSKISCDKWTRTLNEKQSPPKFNTALLRGRLTPQQTSTNTRLAPWTEDKGPQRAANETDGESNGGCDETWDPAGASLPTGVFTWRFDVVVATFCEFGGAGGNSKEICEFDGPGSSENVTLPDMEPEPYETEGRSVSQWAVDSCWRAPWSFPHACPSLLGYAHKCLNLQLSMEHLPVWNRMRGWWRCPPWLISVTQATRWPLLPFLPFLPSPLKDLPSPLPQGATRLGRIHWSPFPPTGEGFNWRGRCCNNEAISERMTSCNESSHDQPLSADQVTHHSHKSFVSALSF